MWVGICDLSNKSVLPLDMPKLTSQLPSLESRICASAWARRSAEYPQRHSAKKIRQGKLLKP